MSDFIISAHSQATKTLPTYFNTLCERFIQCDMVRKKNEQDFHQILLVLDGEGRLFCEGEEYRLHQGCAFFTRANTVCSYTNEGGLVSAFLTARGDAIDKLCDYFGYGRLIFSESTDIEGYLKKIAKIREEYAEKRREALLSAYCYAFFADFFEENRQFASSPTDAVALYIEKNYTKKLTLSELARECGCSVSKLCHDFKKKHGFTVFDYILELRLSYARSIIKNTPDATTKKVSVESGFDDVSYFCKAYKKFYGISPMKDRASLDL